MFIHRQHTTFEVFLTKVYDIIACDRNSYELKMKMKYPVTEKSVLVPVRNDENISALAYAASQTLGTAIEVYVIALNVIAEADESTPSLSTGARNKRGRGL